jgi:hypothetical protein
MKNVAGRKRVDGNYARRPRSPFVSGVELQEAIGTERHADHPAGDLLHPAQPNVHRRSAAGETQTGLREDCIRVRQYLRRRRRDRGNLVNRVDSRMASSQACDRDLLTLSLECGIVYCNRLP